MGYAPGIRYGIRNCGQHLQCWTTLLHEEPALVAGPRPIDQLRRLLPSVGFDDRAGLLYHRHVTVSKPQSAKSIIVQSRFQDCASQKKEGDRTGQ